MIDVPPRRITDADLHHCVETLPPETKDDDGSRAIVLANTVIEHFLGREWFNTHIRDDVPKPGFVRLDFSSDSRRAATVLRRINLAENLFNLQHIEGFDACIRQMKGGGEKIESTYTELDFGRLLYIHNVTFRFVTPTRAKGRDYDFDVIYPNGLVVPADAKCKFETTPINPDSLRNSLKKARTQLPADRPGIVFIEVPQNWIADLSVAKAMEDVGNQFFKTTDRVVSIKYYVYHLTVDEYVRDRYLFRELTNQGSRFYVGADWDLFKSYYIVPPSWNGMPPKWQRIFFFPNSAQTLRRSLFGPT